MAVCGFHNFLLFGTIDFPFVSAFPKEQKKKKKVFDYSCWMFENEALFTCKGHCWDSAVDPKNFWTTSRETIDPSVV